MLVSNIRVIFVWSWFDLGSVWAAGSTFVRVMMDLSIKEEVFPCLALKQPAHPPQWQTERTAVWNIKLQCVSSECQQVKGQHYNVGKQLLMNEVSACVLQVRDTQWDLMFPHRVFSWPERSLKCREEKNLHVLFSPLLLSAWTGS